MRVYTLGFVLYVTVFKSRYPLCKNLCENKVNYVEYSDYEAEIKLPSVVGGTD